jgi:peptidoglycan/xylan/chitin deacetylase (PgdA/CDA1 family)
MNTQADPTQRRIGWRPSGFIGASVVGHAAAAAVVALRPAVWPWALGGLVADQAILLGAGLWPRSSLLGPNWTRLPAHAAARGEVALTIDDGPEPEVTPPLLDLLDRHGARATFFCIGEKVAAQPALARDIIRRGHAIENHSQRHSLRFSLFGPRAMATEIATAQEVIASVVGVAPRFFRAPAGLRNPFLDPVLARLGLRLASWTRRGFDTVNSSPSVVLGRLTRGLGPGDILLLHDGHAARSAAGLPVAVGVLPNLLNEFAARGLKPVTLDSAL